MSTAYHDADSDGYGASYDRAEYCAAPEGWLPTAGDCDDTNATISPGGVEACDHVDNDCDGAIDEAGATGETTSFDDVDGDGYGDPDAATSAWDVPAGNVLDDTDCNDDDRAIHPGATETCDNVDEDCDGATDDNPTDATTFYTDADGDGYGSPSATSAACAPPARYASTSTDCNDADRSINPGATEVCDAGNVDEDCDGRADDNDGSVDLATGTLLYVDNDRDGYGGAATATRCDAGSGHASVTGDCDDRDAGASPGLAEWCDAANVDEDCDGLADDADTGASGQFTWWQDADGDGYGDSTVTLVQCDAPAGYVATGGDGDTVDPAIHPLAPEVCGDDVDHDCDGSLACDIDTSDAITGWYATTSSGTVDRVVRVPDYDGDGVEDLLLGIPYDSSNKGRAILVSGASTGEVRLPTAGIWSMTGSDVNDVLGTGAAWGDFDGDGTMDVVVGASGDSDVASGAGAIYTLGGGESGGLTKADAWATIQGTRSTAIGARLDAGDLDDDGIDELVTTSNSADGGKNFIFHGIAAGTSSFTTHSWEVTGPNAWDVHGANLGFGGSPIADLNGDGVTDLVTACVPCDANGVSFSGAVYVDYGPITGPISVTSSDLTLVGDAANAELGLGTSAEGDVNGDGVVDLVLGGSGTVWLYSAVGSGSGTASDFAYARITGGAGPYLTNGADIDGDGFPDIAYAVVAAGYVGVIGGGPGFTGDYTVDDAAWRITSGASSLYTYPNHLTWLGDVDGDGGDELVPETYSTTWGGGEVWVVGF